MHRLRLNKQLICEGDAKSLNALFNDLSGVSFARSKSKANWLDKMSSAESYTTYLSIKAAEYSVDKWQGRLILSDSKDEVLRVHLFDTHNKITDCGNTKAV